MDPIQFLKIKDKKLSKVIDKVGELDFTAYNNETDCFLFLVKEIVGQMISSGVKKVLFSRLLVLCDNNISPNTISNLTVEQLRGIGLSYSKSNYILNLANIVASGDVDFKRINALPDDEVVKSLTRIKGIGNWTSKMYLIFFLRREDVLPCEDVAFLQAYKWLYNTSDIKPESVAKRCKKWKPYTSIGARYLYKALDNGLTKIPIKDFLNDNI